MTSLISEKSSASIIEINDFSSNRIAVWSKSPIGVQKSLQYGHNQRFPIRNLEKVLSKHMTYVKKT